MLGFLLGRAPPWPLLGLRSGAIGLNAVSFLLSALLLIGIPSIAPLAGVTTAGSGLLVARAARADGGDRCCVARSLLSVVSASTIMAGEALVVVYAERARAPRLRRPVGGADGLRRGDGRAGAAPAPRAARICCGSRRRRWLLGGDRGRRCVPASPASRRGSGCRRVHRARASSARRGSDLRRRGARDGAGDPRPGVRAGPGGAHGRPGRWSRCWPVAWPTGRRWAPRSRCWQLPTIALSVLDPAGVLVRPRRVAAPKVATARPAPDAPPPAADVPAIACTISSTCRVSRGSCTRNTCAPSHDTDGRRRQRADQPLADRTRRASRRRSPCSTATRAPASPVATSRSRSRGDGQRVPGVLAEVVAGVDQDRLAAGRRRPRPVSASCVEEADDGADDVVVLHAVRTSAGCGPPGVGADQPDAVGGSDVRPARGRSRPRRR